MPSARMWRRVAVMALSTIAVTSQAQRADPFSDYRQMFGDDNPAIFAVEEGAALWAEARGPRQVSLARCDLGLGPGRVEGAYARLPRYFADTGRVMDLEARLVHCMVELQGFDRQQLVSDAFASRGESDSGLEALAAYVADASRGETIAVPQSHPAEKAAYATGEALFWRRAGPYDFACASCHRQNDKRVRLQDLPNLTTATGSRFAFSAWPAYRISQGRVRTMEWRMRNCIRQQRLPMLQVGSEAAVDLIMYMGVNANGGTMDAPGLKR